MVDGTSRNAVTITNRRGQALFTTVLALGAAFGVACSSSDDNGSKIEPVGGSGSGGDGGGGGFTTGGSSGSGTGGATAGTGGTPGTGGTSGTGGSSGTSGTGGSGGTALQACETGVEGLGDCGTQAVGAQVKRPNLLIVLDRSGSTTTQPPGFTTSIWDGLKTALATALDSTKDQANFGLELYPFPVDPTKPILEDCGGDGNCCELPTDANVNVPVADGATAVPQIVDALNATSPGGGTPTAAALRRALNYYTTGAGATLSGEKYVLLATDGAPNCDSGITCDATTCTASIENYMGTCCADTSTPCLTNCCTMAPEACLDDAATISAITDLANAGIKTFVVGVPGTEKYADQLNQFAVAGGVPNNSGTDSYYRVDAADGVQALTDTFQTITTQLVTSCDIALSMPPADETKVNVAIDCVVLPKDGTDGTDGWTLVNNNGSYSIQILGSTCTYVEGGVQRVDIFLGCPTVVIR